MLRNSRLRFSLIIVLLVLSGCGGLVKPAQPAYTKAEASAAQAERELALAATSPSPDKELHQLEAAKAYVRLKDTARAETVFRDINVEALPQTALADFILSYAALATAQDDYDQARTLLTNDRMQQQWQQLPVAEQIQWRRARGDLFALLGDESAAVAEYVDLAALLTDPDEKAAVHDTLWRVLNRIDDPTLRQLSARATDVNLRGWYELGIAGRVGQGDIRQEARNFNAWRVQWPQHPAALQPPANFRQLTLANAEQPQQIALLLPLGGSHGLAGTTVRNGFLAAWYDLYGRDKGIPPVRIYDTATTDVIAAYQKAVAGGADLVIGPLREEDIRSLAAQPALPVPVIGLNRFDDSQAASENFFQFGIAVTDEAAQVAERAWREGHRAALAITPGTPWGKNALEAFRANWLSRGGTIVIVPPYAMAQQDFTALLRPILLPGLSAQDVARMARAAAKDPALAPRRRQDIDMVFLVAYPEQGRQIKPTLDFLFARDLPVYATSFIYLGRDNRDRNQDLDPIRFSAMPWSIGSQGGGRLKPDAGTPPAYRPLFALGVDAFQLHQWLPVLKTSPQSSIQGYTGTLTMDADRRIRRELPWAQFRDGMVVPSDSLLEPAP